MRQLNNRRRKLVLFDIDYTLFDTDKFKQSKLLQHSLYDEVVSVLQDLSGIAELGILSEGDLSFQKEKLVKTEIEKHFSENHVFIVPDKLIALDEILKKYKKYKLYLVDDRLQVLEKAKKLHSSIMTVWVKRGPFAIQSSSFKPDKTIENLTALVSLTTSESL